MKKWVTRLLVLLAVAVGLAFGSLNVQEVEVNLLWWTVPMPLAALLAGFFAAGAIVAAALLVVFSLIPQRMRFRKVEKRATSQMTRADHSADV